jgi:hypothetical protein
MRERNVKCILEEFDDHTHKDEDRHVQVNEWYNGEGVDIHFKDGQKFSLSWQQYITLRKLVNNQFLWNK